MLDYIRGREANPGWVRRLFVPDAHVRTLKGKAWCIFVDIVVMVPDTNNLIVNIKFIKMKVTVTINLKRPNYNDPVCNSVGRHLTFPVATTRYIP